MILNEKGKFHLSEPINKYLPFNKTQVLKQNNGSEKLLNKNSIKFMIY